MKFEDTLKAMREGKKIRNNLSKEEYFIYIDFHTRKVRDYEGYSGVIFSA